MVTTAVMTMWLRSSPSLSRTCYAHFICSAILEKRKLLHQALPHVPFELIVMLDHARNLEFTVKPDYDYIRGLMWDLHSRSEEPHMKLEWAAIKSKRCVLVWGTLYTTLMCPNRYPRSKECKNKLNPYHPSAESVLSTTPFHQTSLCSSTHICQQLNCNDHKGHWRSCLYDHFVSFCAPSVVLQLWYLCLLPCQLKLAQVGSSQLEPSLFIIAYNTVFGSLNRVNISSEANFSSIPRTKYTLKPEIIKSSWAVKILQGSLAHDCDRAAIQKMICAVQSCAPAWNISPEEDLSMLTLLHAHPMWPEVKKKIRKLVKMSLTLLCPFSFTIFIHMCAGTQAQLIQALR